MVARRLTTSIRARAAAATHRWPDKKLQVILVSGQDGAQLTVACLASILKREGHKVGLITSRLVEVAGERVHGSDQADILGDPFRMQALLAQMRRAKCAFALIEVPARLPEHGFTGLRPAMVIMRRCGDTHLNAASNTASTAALRRLLALRPQAVVLNRDDPTYQADFIQQGAATMTFGASEKAECQITGVKMHPKGSAVLLTIDHQTELQLASTLTGKGAVYSLVAAAAAAYLLHMPISVIEDTIATLKPDVAPMRYLDIARPYNVVCDTSVTPDGVLEAMDALKHFTKNRLIAVFGTTLSQPAQWRPILGELIAQQADRLIVTDGEYRAQESPQAVRQSVMQGVAAASAEARTNEVPGRDKALLKAFLTARRGDTVFIASTTTRPYRQTGDERIKWNDEAKVEEALS